MINIYFSSFKMNSRAIPGGWGALNLFLRIVFVRGAGYPKICKPFVNKNSHVLMGIFLIWNSLSDISLKSQNAEFSGRKSATCIYKIQESAFLCVIEQLTVLNVTEKTRKAIKISRHHLQLYGSPALSGTIYWTWENPIFEKKKIQISLLEYQTN